jgi:putative transcriptional regulator|tara:strand:+ start:370 stop:1035 length:666 start_codon:yes stop_codon:yes gene_type:complete
MNTHRAPILFEKQVIITLKGIRRSKKITQTDLANRMGVSRDTIARIESGKARIYLAQVVAIANELDIMLHDLFLQHEQKEETIVFSNENINLSNKNIHIRLSSPTVVAAISAATTYTRNPYLDEKAVDSYGELMKKYILDHRLFWHWVPVDDLPGLSISSVVEATLNQGREEDVKWLFDTISTEKVADIFRRQITGTRHGYTDMTKNYFEAYFKRHAPKHT